MFVSLLVTAWPISQKNNSKERRTVNLQLSNLENCFQAAKENGARYVGVLIEMEGFEKPEVIINEAENIESKLEYYKKAYDDNLNHRFSKGIKMIGFSYGDGFDEIEHDLIG
jgi:hypothetical protein